MLDRREAILATLFGTGLVGLRALATGLPASLVLNPRKALAAAASSVANDKAQFIIFNTSGAGDPINTSVPGTYEDPSIVHSADAQMAPGTLSLGGRTYTAARPWTMLPREVLDRTTFWHIMTNTPIHPDEPEVLKLMGATSAAEMLPSILAKQLAASLGTLQTQPITIGATSPAEALSFGGAALPIVPPLALKSTLTSAPGPLTDLQALRDQTLNQLYDVYRKEATTKQRAYIDALVTSQGQVRNINQALLDALSSIKDNTAESQVLAAVALIQMKVAPVVSIHIPFGGDNHRDAGLEAETLQTVSGVATIGSLMQALKAAGLADRVSLVTLNVFGRTLGPGNHNGRSHNSNHQVSFTIGKPFRAGVIGGVGPLDGDYGALPIDSKTGLGSLNGDIARVGTLASFGRTLLAAFGVDAGAIDSLIPSGQVIAPALA
jgi:hypothetical protein